MEYIQLALEHKPLNLGQGFPDFAAPEYVTKALADTADGDNMLHQYTRGFVCLLYTSLLGFVMSLYGEETIMVNVECENSIIT